MDSYENKNYEQEIDLKDLMFSVLRKWRPVILIAVLFAVLLGGYKLFSGMRQLSNAEFMKEAEETYSATMEQYNSTKEHYVTQIENINDELEQQQKYKEESVLMNMNPYDVHTATTTFYISTDYQIMPGMAYQNPNMAASILQAYMSVIQNCELYSDKQENIDGGMDIQYLKELVRIEPARRGNYTKADGYNNLYLDNNMFTVTVIGDTEQRASDVMEWILNCVLDSHDMVAQAVGSHQLNIVENSNYVSVDLGLVEDQGNFTKTVGALEEALEKTKKSQSELKMPAASMISRSEVLKSSVKYGILGGVLGGFAAVFFICVTFLMSDSFVNERELKRRYGIRVLGTFAGTGKKKAFSFVDTWFDRLEGKSGKMMDDHATYDMIAANAGSHTGDARSILLVGTVDSADLERVLSGLKGLLPGLSLSAGGNPCKDARTVRETASSDAVIIVEKRSSSTFTDIEQELDLINGLDKRVLGCIVL